MPTGGFLYSPEVPAGAIPPSNFPPRHTWSKAFSAAAVFAVASFLDRLLRNYYARADDAGWVAAAGILAAVVLACVVTVWALLSSVRRSKSSGLFKAVCAVAAVVLVGLALRSIPRAAHRQQQHHQHHQQRSPAPNDDPDPDPDSFLLALAQRLTWLLAEPLTQHLAQYAGFLLLCAAAYAVVSRVYLERPSPFGSRYGDTREFLKLVATLPPIYVAFSSVAFPSAPPELYAAGLWVGTHVVFLDNFALLQSFG